MTTSQRQLPAERTLLERSDTNRAQLFLDGTQMPRPHCRGIAEEIRARVRIASQELSQRLVTLAPITRSARSHQVATGSVTLADSWLDVIDSQIHILKHTTTIHAPPAITHEHVSPAHTLLLRCPTPHLKGSRLRRSRHIFPYHEPEAKP